MPASGGSTLHSAAMPRTALILLLLAAAPAGAAEIQPPAAFLGHEVGADRKLAPWPKVVEYLRLVDAASPRVSMEVAGRSTLDHEIPVVVVTSEANQANLPRLREIARRL